MKKITLNLTLPTGNHDARVWLDGLRRWFRDQRIDVEAIADGVPVPPAPGAATLALSADVSAGMTSERRRYVQESMGLPATPAAPALLGDATAEGRAQAQDWQRRQLAAREMY